MHILLITPKTPLRAQSRSLRPADAARVVLAGRRDVWGYRNLYRDDPKRQGRTSSAGSDC